MQKEKCLVQKGIEIWVGVSFMYRMESEMQREKHFEGIKSTKVKVKVFFNLLF